MNKYLYIIFASPIIVAVAMTFVFLQPKIDQCQSATVVELESDLSADILNDFKVAAVTEKGLVVIDDVDAEYFYTLHISDEVQVCDHIGKYIPTHDISIEEN